MKRILSAVLVVFLTLGWVSPVFASSTPVVQAVFFFSPDWANYQKVVTEYMPPLRAKYGAQLEVSMLDVSTAKGQVVYQAAIQQFNIPGKRQDLPTVIIGSTVLVGLDEISTQFPGLVEKNLQTGGSPRPDIPGLNEALAVDATQFGANAGGAPANNNSFANGLAQFILVGMVAVVGVELYRQPWKKDRKSHLKTDWRDSLTWVIPTLVLVGLVVSGYLSYVEITATTAICGPVGDCNAVQTSSYSRLFGILPIGVLGILGNLAILAAWVFKKYGPRQFNRRAALALVGLVSFGILFSIYLTFLEPFVIGATCAWCLTSAVVMTGLFWTTLETAWK
jgi:uncharacterized membrane protein